jgi:hypothetical protein
MGSEFGIRESICRKRFDFEVVLDFLLKFVSTAVSVIKPGGPAGVRQPLERDFVPSQTQPYWRAHMPSKPPGQLGERRKRAG